MSRFAQLPVAGKLAAGFAAATLALGAVGAAAATVVTSSPDPSAWGQQVKQAVEQCKDDLKAGRHGIGDCVSAFAEKHGDAKQAAHHKKGEASESPKPSESPDKDDVHGASGPTEGKSDKSHGQGADHRNPNASPSTEGKSDEQHPSASPHPQGSEGTGDSHSSEPSPRP